MEGPRGRARYRGSYSGARAMSISRSRSRGGFSGAVGGGRAAYRRVVYRRGGTVARRARALLNRRTAGFLGLEKKFFDTAVALVAVPAPTDATGGEFDPTALPAATLCLSAPAQGDGEQNRDGKRIVIKSVQVKGVCRVPPAELQAAPPTSTKVFVALVLDTQTNGAQLNSEDVFKNLSAEAAQNTDLTRNLLFGSRFKILKSGVFDVTPASMSHFAVDSFSYSGIACEFDWFVPLELPVNFNAGTTAVIANVVDNSLHMIAFSTNATLGPTIGYNARIRFMG